MMIFSLLVHYLSTIFILPCHCAVFSMFTAPMTIKFGWQYSASILQRPGRSAVECAALCSEWTDCVSFHFADANQTCMLSDGDISATIGKVYGIRCPSQLGYKLFRDGKIKLCLKTVSTLVQQPIAANDCIDDGGHLLLVENEEARQLAASVLGGAGIDIAWIDGYDATKDKVYINWKGQTIDYLPWEAPDPGYADEQCLVMVQVFGYRFRDGQCNRVYAYVCQMS